MRYVAVNKKRPCTTSGLATPCPSYDSRLGPSATVLYRPMAQNVWKRLILWLFNFDWSSDSSLNVETVLSQYSNWLCSLLMTSRISALWSHKATRLGLDSRHLGKWWSSDCTDVLAKVPRFVWKPKYAVFRLLDIIPVPFYSDMWTSIDYTLNVFKCIWCITFHSTIYSVRLSISLPSHSILYVFLLFFIHVYSRFYVQTFYSHHSNLYGHRLQLKVHRISHASGPFLLWRRCGMRLDFTGIKTFIQSPKGKTTYETKTKNTTWMRDANIIIIIIIIKHLQENNSNDPNKTTNNEPPLRVGPWRWPSWGPCLVEKKWSKVWISKAFPLESMLVDVSWFNSISLFIVVV